MSLSPIGNVFTPPGFQAFSYQAQVLLTWNQAPLATSYVLLRSADNITFTQIGTTSSLSYSDTTGTLSAVYYYQIQASQVIATVTTYSQPTVSLAAQSLKPGQTTVGNLRLEAQQRINKENSQFYTTQEWNSMISQSYKELYDILIQKFGDDYFLANPYTYTTSGTIDSVTQQSTYPLPPDFYKLMRVEVALNPGDPNSWITLKEFQAIQANLWNYPNVYTFYGITNLRYRLWGTNLVIAPIPSAGQTIRILYSPRPNQLINDTDTVDAISGWEEYIISDVCIKALAKEESDPSVFLLQKQALLKRIEEAAENRNVGEPETVSDSKLRNFAWSDDNSGGSSRW